MIDKHNNLITIKHHNNLISSHNKRIIQKQNSKKNCTQFQNKKTKKNKKQ